MPVAPAHASRALFLAESSRRGHGYCDLDARPRPRPRIAHPSQELGSGSPPSCFICFIVMNEFLRPSRSPEDLPRSLKCVSFIRLNHKAIPAARAKLAAALPSTTEILRGSLLHRRIRHCTGCAVCARGPGHLVWVLTVSYPGGPATTQSLRRTETLGPTVAPAGPVIRWRGAECAVPPPTIHGQGDLMRSPA